MGQLPKEVILAIKRLNEAGFEAYAVGGCVRDFLLKKAPKDWDLATSATPEEIQKVFEKSFYENRFGTVTVFVDEIKLEVTTYRTEEAYSDSRHPDSVKYTKSLEEDLKRRDFTINAMALSRSGEVIDHFNGKKDLENKIIRAVGDPKERFKEDALRLMRAVRFASQLNFLIDENTEREISLLSGNIERVSKERIRDELVKIVTSNNPKYGFNLMLRLNLLKYVLPETFNGVGVGQNKHHIYDVFEHNINALQYTADQKYTLEVRLGALFHDVAKPQTKRGDGYNSTFYNHDIVGAKFTRNIMKRLKFSNEEIDKVSLLVRYHLFYYNVDEVTESSVRRLISKVGLENMEDLIKVRYADRIGSGTPKAEPYKIRHLKYIIDKVSKDPISVKMLKIKGDDIMKILNMRPGQKIGLILNALLSEVLDDSSRNNEEYLQKRAVEMNDLSITELSNMVKRSEESIEIIEKEHKKRFRV
ncbi:HD domain-containing protein [Candidatus Azambacteria bacterium]|nr:HD domain-containing protein [Candidatus Azambacteria bacterium]